MIELYTHLLSHSQSWLCSLVLAGSWYGHHTRDVGDWGLETTFSGCRDFGIKVAPHAVLSHLVLRTKPNA
jgi:hypothetical protein